MSLEERINQDLKEAMKAKDDVALRGIRAIKAAILLEKTSGAKHDLSQDVEMKILQKLVKQRRESLDIYEKNGREDLAKTEREEIAIIERYLPQQLSEAELRSEIQAIVTATGASSMKDMGKVMGMATKKLAGRADGKAVSDIVKELLGS
ncbi:MAG: GatB/YqeY domain-containing protein [Phaeodactylibacter sp.]|nr:GatB/YqeY domain-containing protein [Phaeodactylibacter sp.]MCB9303180.1 GatB/YqeY domain-containing protein [Lewinellaceae bacterium]